MRKWEWEGMGINILLREGIFLYATMGMGLECDGNENLIMGKRGNRIEKVIPAHLWYLCIHMFVYIVPSLGRSWSQRSMEYEHLLAIR